MLFKIKQKPKHKVHFYPFMFKSTCNGINLNAQVKMFETVCTYLFSNQFWIIYILTMFDFFSLFSVFLFL